MKEPIYRYQLLADKRWQDIEPDEAFGILQGTFGSVSPAIAAMVINSSMIETTEGLMRIRI